MTIFEVLVDPLFLDRVEAGRRLAVALREEARGPCVVVGLARGGVEVAAEIAEALDAPLDAVAVRKIRHPWQPEYALGAVTPGEGVYVRGPNGLDEEEIAEAVGQAVREAADVDAVLHADRPAAELAGKTAILVDDGLATGATMIAAARWAHARDAARVVAAVPVAATVSAALLRPEVDDLVVLHALDRFFAVGVWYENFAQVDDDEVVALLDAAADRVPAGGRGHRRLSRARR